MWELDEITQGIEAAGISEMLYMKLGYLFNSSLLYDSSIALVTIPSLHHSSLGLASLPSHHVLEKQFKPVAQCTHVRIHGFLKLERMRHHLDGPMLQLRVLARLEAQMEVARVLGVDTESVNTAFRVGFRVGC